MADDKAPLDEFEQAASDPETDDSPRPFEQKPIKGKPEPEKSGGHGG